MSDLRETLDRALRTADAGEPPTGEVMRRGKGIRLRRRLTAAAGIVVVVAAVLTGYRSLSGPQALLTPTDPRYVTVTPPGPGSPPNLVASGTIGKQFWRVFVEKPTSSGEFANELCVYGRGSVFAYSSTSTRAAAGSGPVCLDSIFPGDIDNSGNILAPRTFGWFAVLAPDVAYVEVNLKDGQELRLIPVECYGMRLVAFFLPGSGIGVATGTAYLNRGGHLVGVPAIPGVQSA